MFKRFLVVLMVFGLFAIQLQAWPWSSFKKGSQSQVSVREMERTLSRLEKFAGKIEKMSDVDWNPVYAGLCYTINDYGRAVIPLLLRDVQDKSKDWKYRYMLVDRLIFVEGKEADDQWLICEELMTISENNDEEANLRKNSINALSRLAGTSSLMDDERRREVAKELVGLAKDNREDFQIRWEVIRDLSRFAKHYGDIIEEPLLELSSDTNNRIRASSISTLVTVSNFSQDVSIKSRVNTLLVNRLKVEQDNLVKDQIIYGIKTLKVREAIPLLMESLKIGKYCGKGYAAELLGIMKVREAVPYLIGGLWNEKNSLISYRCSEALGRIGDERAVEPLIELLTKGRFGESAAIPLAKIGDRGAIQPLIEKLEGDTVFQWDVAQALIMLNAREAIPVIEGKMPKRKFYGSALEFKQNFERFKRGEKVEWEEK